MARTKTPPKRVKQVPKRTLPGKMAPETTPAPQLTQAVPVTQAELEIAARLEVDALAEYHKRRGIREYLEVLVASPEGDIVKAVQAEDVTTRAQGSNGQTEDPTGRI